MKLFITSASVLALFVGLSSCEKHVWKDEDGKGVVELYKSHDDHGHDEAGHETHSEQEAHDEKR